MENTDVHQLPEVDSLPDGFVESSEPPASQTLTIVQEKPLGESEHDGICEFGSENATRQRTFPVPLREADSLEAPRDMPVHLAKVPDNGQRGQESLPMPDSAGVNSLCFDSVAGGSDSKEVPGSCRSSDRSIEGALDTHARGTSLVEITELQKGRKLETAETKRKNTKKTSLSEKDILEFTLKYQQALAERDAAIAVRDKLESLCRELQRQNKMLTDECKRVSTEGQNLRLDLSVRFQDAIKDVSTRLEEQKEESISQLKENEMLRSKLKQLVNQYNLAEQQHAQKLKQKELELELAHFKNKQHEEKLIQEQSQTKIYAEEVSQLLATEKTLRLQLTSDGEKFQQFQEALLKSNEVFETFKLEIEKMAKSTKDLKKENQFLKSKCEKTDVMLIELVEERERLKKQLEKTKNQKEKLESLCRSLHAERKQKSTGSNNSDVTND